MKTGKELRSISGFQDGKTRKVEESIMLNAILWFARNGSD